MILGRSPALFVALAAAIINVAGALHVFTLTADQWATIDAAIIAFIGVVANEAQPGTVGTFAPTTTPGASAHP